MKDLRKKLKDDIEMVVAEYTEYPYEYEQITNNIEKLVNAFLESKLEKSPWISCKDQEPPKGITLCVYNKWEGQNLAYLDVDGWRLSENSRSLWYNPTHYMQIQAPPKE